MHPPPLRDVEWQLVMHCCAHADIVRVARCSKAFLHAASSPFAWRHSIARFDSSRHPPPRAGIASLARVHYIWKPARRYPQDTAELVATKLLIDHLDASDCTFIDVRCWEQVLRSPMMQRVTRLSFPRGLHTQFPSMSFDFMPWIRALPQLTTLDLAHMLVMSLDYNAKAFAELPASLTAFSMRGHPQAALMREDHPIGLSLFSRCRLKHLSLSQFGLRLSRMAEIFQQPSMSGLETLWLEDYDFLADVHRALGEAAVAAAGVRARTFTVAILSALKRLSTLHVRSCEGLDALFTALSRSIRLREFIYEPAVKISKSRRLKITAECDAIMAQALPRLHLTLMLFPSERIPDTAGTDHFRRHFQEKYPLRASVQHAKREFRPVETRCEVRDRQRIIVLPSRPIQQDSSCFGALPSVLIQLVFRTLPAQEALVLARCSRTLLKMADAPSAFCTLTLSATRMLTIPLDQSNAGLLRHVPFRLKFFPDEAYFVVRDLIPCLQAHSQFRLTEFEASNSIQYSDWGMSSSRTREKHCDFFRCPAFQSTKAVVLFVIDESLFRTLSLLPSLQRLQMHPRFWMTPDPLHFYGTLPQFQSLKVLHVVHPTQINQLLPLLHRIPSLRVLLLQPMSDETLRRLHRHGQRPWEEAMNQPVLKGLNALPSAAALVDLLTANESLCMILVSRPCPRWDEVDIAARRVLMRTALLQVRDEIPQRYHERIKVPAAGQLS